MIDLDDEIIEVILARQPVSRLIADQADRLIVMAVLRVFTPGVFGPDWPDRQQGARLRVAVGTPPQLPGVEGASGGAAVTLPLVGKDAAAAKCHRHGPAVGGQPAPARIAGSGSNADRRERSITRICLISD